MTEPALCTGGEGTVGTKKGTLSFLATEIFQFASELGTTLPQLGEFVVPSVHTGRHSHICVPPVGQF